MRQRNDTFTALYAPADPPFSVLPGETIDYPVHLTGLTRLDDEHPAVATGGIVDPAMTFPVGEKGPELVPTPPKKKVTGRAPTGEEPTE